MSTQLAWLTLIISMFAAVGAALAWCFVGLMTMDPLSLLAEMTALGCGIAAMMRAEYYC